MSFPLSVWISPFTSLALVLVPQIIKHCVILKRFAANCQIPKPGGGSIQKNHCRYDLWTDAMVVKKYPWNRIVEYESGSLSKNKSGFASLEIQVCQAIHQLIRLRLSLFPGTGLCNAKDRHRSRADERAGRREATVGKVEANRKRIPPTGNKANNHVDIIAV